MIWENFLPKFFLLRFKPVKQKKYHNIVFLTKHHFLLKNSTFFQNLMALRDIKCRILKLTCAPDFILSVNYGQS
jgi:hypothetical protein